MARDWVHRAIDMIDADFHRSADTHLIALPLACHYGPQFGSEVIVHDVDKLPLGRHLRGNRGHEHGGGAFAGPGWFGQLDGETAISVWGDDVLAPRLGLRCSKVRAPKDPPCPSR